jgi:hypothetical protein
MSNFEIKTHKIGRTYTKPHFFILNKGLNSGKPLDKPCPNCFVITTQTIEQRQTLFYLCLSLKIGGYFQYYLKGSVIPFITKNDCLGVLKKAYLNNLEDINSLKKHIQTINQIQQKEDLLKQQIEVVKKLKVAFIHSYFRDKSKVV